MLKPKTQPSFLSGFSAKIEDSLNRLQDLRAMWLPMNENTLLNSFDDHALRDIGLERGSRAQNETPAEHLMRIASERRAMSIGMTGL